MNVVLNCDCMEYMKDLPDNHFDLAIVDPQYGIGVANTDYLGTTKNNKRWKGREDGYRHKIKTWDNAIPDSKYFQELQRVSKNQITWGWNYFVKYFNDCPSYIVWDKETAGSYSDCEMAWCSTKGVNKIFKYLWAGFRKQKPEKRIHPTQKPIALYKWLLQNYAKPGQTIFDSHVGSGSIRIACHDLGFDFHGCEKDRDYWEAQEARYQNHIKQNSLIEPEEIQKLVYKQGEL